MDVTDEPLKPIQLYRTDSLEVSGSIRIKLRKGEIVYFKSENVIFRANLSRPPY